MGRLFSIYYFIHYIIHYFVHYGSVVRQCMCQYRIATPILAVLQLFINIFSWYGYSRGSMVQYFRLIWSINSSLIVRKDT